MAQVDFYNGERFKGVEVTTSNVSAEILNGALAALFALINLENYIVTSITVKQTGDTWRMEAYGRK